MFPHVNPCDWNSGLGRLIIVTSRRTEKTMISGERRTPHNNLINLINSQNSRVEFQMKGKARIRFMKKTLGEAVKREKKS